jgi:hypothetical protein
MADMAKLAPQVVKPRTYFVERLIPGEGSGRQKVTTHFAFAINNGPALMLAFHEIRNGEIVLTEIVTHVIRWFEVEPERVGEE